ncbi:sigma factor, partial [Acinetobacter baumannii]
MLHDTFVRVLAVPDALSEVREPRAYLTTTAKHLMIDRARRRRVECACLDELTLRYEQFGHAPSPEQRMAQA